MSDTTLGNFKTATDVAQFIGGQIGKYYGGRVGEAAANLLLGEPQWGVSAVDLLAKVQNGTATGEDYADVLNATASTLAAAGLLIGGAVPALAVSPLLFEIVGMVGLGLTIYENAPDIWDAIRRWTIPFSQALQAVCPLILDLDGNGVQVTTLDNGVYFDHDGNGFRGNTGQTTFYIAKEGFFLQGQVVSPLAGLAAH